MHTEVDRYGEENVTCTSMKLPTENKTNADKYSCSAIARVARMLLNTDGILSGTSTLDLSSDCTLEPFPRLDMAA